MFHDDTVQSLSVAYAPVNEDYRGDIGGCVGRRDALLTAVRQLSSLRSLHLQSLDLRTAFSGTFLHSQQLTHLELVLCLLPASFFACLASNAALAAALQVLLVSSCEPVSASDMAEFAQQQAVLCGKSSGTAGADSPQPDLTELRELTVVDGMANLAEAVPAVLDWMVVSKLQQVELQAVGSGSETACDDFNAVFASSKACMLTPGHLATAD